MVTPKSVVETTPLVVAWISQHERAQRSAERASAPARPERRPPLRAVVGCCGIPALVQRVKGRRARRRLSVSRWSGC
jgi:hypothetical protein